MDRSLVLKRKPQPHFLALNILSIKKMIPQYSLEVCPHILIEDKILYRYKQYFDPVTSGVLKVSQVDDVYETVYQKQSLFQNILHS